MQHAISILCWRRTLVTLSLPVVYSRVQSSATRTLDRPLTPADIDHHRVLHQDPAQAGVAGPALNCLGGDGEGELALRARRSDDVEQRLERARDLHLDPGLARGELDQRVGPALGRIAIVVGARAARQGLERVAHQRSADRVEQPGDEKAAVILGVQVEKAALCQLGLLLAY